MGKTIRSLDANGTVDQCDFPVDIGFLKGKKCYAGLDLSKTQDLTAFVLVFPPDDLDDEEDKFRILPFFWIPEEALERRVLKDHVPYDQWLAHGLIEATDGAVINYNFIQRKIEELGQLYDIKEIAFDRWGATMLTQNLRDAGFTIADFGQGYKSMSPPMEELMRLVLSGRIAHGGNKVLRWNFDNIVVQQDEAGNIKPDKKRATEKIDGAVAAIMALDRAIKNESHESIYDKTGMLVIDLDDPTGYYRT
jgi:phage terminase large subunit-like protein